MGSDGFELMQSQWCDEAEMEPPEIVGPRYYSTPHEERHGLDIPTNVYPMFENALRMNLGRTVDEHMRIQSDLFSSFSRVASKHPEHSWFPTYHTAENMMNPGSAGNRWVAFPYTKFHCAVMNVNQGASAIVMSAAEAQRRGVPSSKVIYLHGAAETVEKEILQRPNLHRSPAMHRMGTELFSNANVSAKQLTYKNLYSCFPVAVSVVVDELGLEYQDGSNLTMTGGLPYHGGV